MDIPLAYIPIDRQRAMAAGRSLPDRCYGAAVFVDITGFTKLTDDLVAQLGDRQGVDELTQVLNAIYGALIEEIHGYSGSIIGFSGDAITCWFDQTLDVGNNASLRTAALCATACALAMQRVMAQYDNLETVSGIHMSLAATVGVAVGSARRFVVGDPDIQYIDILAGSTIDRMATAESLAEYDEVVLCPQTIILIQEDIQIAGYRTDDQQADHDPFAILYAMTSAADQLVRSATPQNDSNAAIELLSERQVRPWILPSVYQRLQSGQGQFLAELRRTVSLFLLFDGIDYDADDTAGAKLDAFIQWVQRVLDRYGGCLIQLSTDAKGMYLYGCFGAPVAHADDALRAVGAAIELRSPPAELDAVHNIRIGLSKGRMRSGPCGSEVRQTYAVIGDEVNIAARLMEKATPGQILMSEHVAYALGDRYQIESLGRISVKGRSQPIPIFTVQARESPDLHSVNKRIEAAIDQVQNHQGQIIRLVYRDQVRRRNIITEVLQTATLHNFAAFTSSGHQNGNSDSYSPWQPIFAALLNLDDNTSPERKTTQVTEWVEHVNPEWTPMLPLLGELLALPIPDNDITKHLEAPVLRQGALLVLATELIEHFAKTRPLLIVMERAHLLDEVSQRLALALAHSASNIPLMYILAHDYEVGFASKPSIWTDISQLPNHKAFTESVSLTKILGNSRYVRNDRPSPNLNDSMLTAYSPDRKMVGRRVERNTLETQLIKLIDEQTGGLVIIEGEAGIGKSKLITDMLNLPNIQGVRSLIGAGDAIEQSTPYYAWRGVFRQFFSLDNLPEDAAVRMAQVLAQLPKTTDASLLQLAPLLNAVLPLDLPENDVTEQMRGQVRAENTRELLAQLLQHTAETSPLILILEDAHWLDSASWALAHLVSQIAKQLLLIIVTRPTRDSMSTEFQQMRDSQDTHQIFLEALSPDDTRQLVCQRFSVLSLPEPILNLIQEKAEGHPFFSEELAFALKEAGVISIEDGECRLTASAQKINALAVPDTIEEVITSRIDHLAPAEQLTLKVASVIGRVFPFLTLLDIHPADIARDRLDIDLQILERQHLTQLEHPEPDLSYIFKHIITQEVAYNLMVYTQRQNLHQRVAEWYETHYANDLAAWYPLLAYHWQRAHHMDKALAYLERAGEQALHNGAYREAIRFLKEALDLMSQYDMADSSP